ncbi:hypothetical protein BOX15_Mlig009287g1, partial [Macrostomum lignano]
NVSKMLAILTEVVCLLCQIVADIAKSAYNNFTPASWRSKNISGQTAVVTGAASGLGRLLAIRLSGLGCRLVLIDISTGVDDVAAECRSAGSPKVQAYQCDLSSREVIYATCERLLADFGQRVDILVNNAGVVTGRPFLDCPDAMIRRTMAVNIEAHFWLCKALLPGMIERNCGHVVTVASGAGQLGVPSLSDYCASKFAAVGFDESLKFELASRGNGGVRTTCVCPYYINTGMFDGVVSRFPRLLPVMNPDYVIDKMVQAILTNQELLVLPRLLYYTNIIHKMVPVSVSYKLLNFFGVFDSMAGFRGRQGGADAKKD